MSNDDLTISARVKDWDVFSPDWGYLREFSALQIAPLCALSVGLHPYFSAPGWVLYVALPHFDGTLRDELADDIQPEEKPECDRRATLLREFLRRVHIAAGNLAPAGNLPALEGIPNGEITMVKVSEFIAWAKDKGWEMPIDFSSASGSTEVPMADAPRLRGQEQAILSKLVELSYNPKALPKNSPGKSGVPAICKKALSDSPLFAGTTTFDKAWERLSKFDDIKYSD